MVFSFLGSTGLPGLADRLVPHDADAALRAERHQHEAARLQLEPLRHDVVVGLVERDGEHNRRQLRAGTRFLSSGSNRLCIGARLPLKRTQRIER